MIPAHLDPTHFTALQSLDFGNVLSLDGRAHIFDAMTPVEMVQVPATTVPAGSPTGQQVSAASVIPNVPDVGSAVSSIAGLVLPEHFGARMAVGIIAVALVLIVAARLIL